MILPDGWGGGYLKRPGRRVGEGRVRLDKVYQEEETYMEMH